MAFPYPLKTNSYKDFEGGLNLVSNITNLAPNETPYSKNWITMQGAALSSIPGNSLLATMSATSSGGQFLGVFKPTNTSNSKILLGIQNGVLYSITTSGTVAQLLTGLSTTLLFTGTNYEGDYWITSASDGVIHVYYNSGTLTAQKVSGAPKGAYICNNDAGRLLVASSTTYPNRVFFCSFENGTDWSTSNNAGYFDVDWGDSISALKLIGTDVYIGGTSHIKKANTANPFNISVQDLPVDYGIVSHYSAITMHNWLNFLTPANGFWHFQYFYPETISDKIINAFLGYESPIPGIIPTIGFDLNYLQSSVGVQDGFFYRIALPKSGSSYNNCELFYNTLSKAWWYSEQNNFSYYARDEDSGQIYATDSLNGHIYTLNDGYTFNGTDIALDFYTAPFDGRSPESPKIPIWAILQTRGTGTANVSHGYLLDLGNSSGTTTLSPQQTQNVYGTTTASGILQFGTNANNPQDLWSGTALADNKVYLNGKGRWIQGRFFSSGVSSKVNIYGWELAIVPLLPN